MKLNLRGREEEEEENKNNKKNKNSSKKKRTEEERKTTTIKKKKSNNNIGLNNDCFEYSLVCKEVYFWCPAEEEYSNLVLTRSQTRGFFSSGSFVEMQVHPHEANCPRFMETFELHFCFPGMQHRCTSLYKQNVE